MARSPKLIVALDLNTGIVSFLEQPRVQNASEVSSSYEESVIEANGTIVIESSDDEMEAGIRNKSMAY